MNPQICPQKSGMTCGRLRIPSVPERVLFPLKHLLNIMFPACKRWHTVTSENFLKCMAWIHPLGQTTFVLHHTSSSVLDTCYTSAKRSKGRKLWLFCWMEKISLMLNIQHKRRSYRGNLYLLLTRNWIYWLCVTLTLLPIYLLSARHVCSCCSRSQLWVTAAHTKLW